MPNHDVEILKDTQNVSRTLGILPSTSGNPALILLARSGPRTPRENLTSISEDDFSYLANLSNNALKEELSALAYYTC